MNNLIDDLAGTIANLGADIGKSKADFEKNLKALLQAKLSELDLVSNEEFMVQKNILARMQDKVEKLEKQIAKLES